MNVTTLEKRIAALASRIQLAATALSAVEIAGRSGMTPDVWQRRVLESDARQLILLCSRQAGKSTISSVLATHQAVTVPDSLVLLVAPALRQSQELFRKVKTCYAALGDLVPAVVENTLTLELGNGSRIICLPGSERTIRGLSAPDLIIEDESARVPDELYQAIRPMRATKPESRLILLSSAFGRRGHFYETWEHGGPDWERVKITAYDVPRIDPDWLEHERRAIGSWWFAQEYECQFVDSVDSAFRGEDIDNMASAEVPPLFAAHETGES